MGESVYVDLFFLINFSMDFLCFFLTARLLHRKLSLPRVLAASAIGGIYADLALFFSVGRLLSLVLDVGVCALMCLLALGERKKARTLPLYILVYTAISMTLGGIMTALFGLWNRSAVFEGAEAGGSDGISVWQFFLLALVSGAITLLGGRFFRKKTAQSDAVLEVVYEGKRECFSAMVDSGNLLREPISGRPCIVADCRAMEKLLPPEIISCAKKRPPTPEGLSQTHARRVRIVPANTASGGGLLLAVRPEEILLRSPKGSHPIDAMIALCELDKGADGKEALLPSQLLI